MITHDNVTFKSLSEAEHFINDGDIMFIRSNRLGLLDNLISFFTWSKYTHVGIVCWANIDHHRILVMLDVNGGVKRRILSVSHYQKYDMDVVSSPIEWSEIKPSFIERLGEKDYSLLQAAYVGISEFFHRTIGVSLPHKQFETEICSQVVSEKLGFEDTNISPAKLYDKLKEQGQSIKIRIRR